MTRALTRFAFAGGLAVGVMSVAAADVAHACKLNTWVYNDHEHTRIRLTHFCVQKQGTSKCHDMINWNMALAWYHRYVEAGDKRGQALNPTRKDSTVVRVQALVKNMATGGIRRIYSDYGACDSIHNLRYPG